MVLKGTFKVAHEVWVGVFFYLNENNIIFEGILLKPSMVIPGAECKDKASPKKVVEYTLKLLHGIIPPAMGGVQVSLCFYLLRNWPVKYISYELLYNFHVLIIMILIH